MNFNELWNLLYQHGASAKKEEGTRRFWNTLTPQQQSYAFTTINNNKTINTNSSNIMAIYKKR